jgi:hypothetical protein
MPAKPDPTVGEDVLVRVPMAQPNAIRPVTHDFAGTVATVNDDGTVDVLDEEDVLFDSVPAECVNCQACEGRGWRVMSSESLPQAIQRCDACQVYESDLEAAEACGLPYTIRNRETGEPCEATADSPWEAAVDG